jgi:hypothetical protein
MVNEVMDQLNIGIVYHPIEAGQTVAHADKEDGHVECTQTRE